MKRQLRLLAALTLIALIIGGLVFALVRYGVKDVTKAIDAVGKVTYSAESRALIDAADKKIAALDPNLHLTEKVKNIDILKAAKVTYVEQAIIRMYRAVRDKQDEDTIKQYLSDAEEAFSHYLTEEDIPLVHNYQDLIDARAKYGNPTDEPPEKGLRELKPKETTIDLC